MEIVDNSIDKKNIKANRTTKYKYWKQSLYKWDEYIANRHKQVKSIDPWSKYCLDNIRGRSAVYNSGGLYLKEFNNNLTVIEHTPCPIEIAGMDYVLGNFSKFNDSFDSIIMLNPIALKYNHCLWDFLTVERQSRAGYKGNILKWMNAGAQIFLSFSDWHMYYDRLRFDVDEFINDQLRLLNTHNIRCIYKDVQPSQFDIINGNIKLVLTVEPSCKLDN